METYKKPIILNYNAGRGVIPFAVAIAPIAVTTGFSVAQAAVAAGAAALAGAAVGAAVANKGNNIIITEFTSVLSKQKNFVLT